MARYTTRRPQAGKPLFIETPLWDDQAPFKPHLIVDNHVASFTGLLDADGDEIWREPNPMGFSADL